MAEKNYKLPNPLHASLRIKPDSGNAMVLPFLENVQVKERGTTRLGEYKIIGRSTNLYAYTGAESREFTLTFHLTLPTHIHEYGSSGGERRYSQIIDLLRSCTVNAKTSGLGEGGAPTVELRYGDPWDKLKCVCQNYNISVIEKAGYVSDIGSLMTPRRIKVTMSLVEVEIPQFDPGGTSLF